MNSPDPVAATPTLEARGVEKHFTSGDGSELRILQGVELRVAPGEVVSITGASGVGKSTLLHLLGGLDRPTAGEILVGGEPVAGMDPDALAEVRNRRLGFVFQFHHLLRDFTAQENVAIPCRISGSEEGVALGRARELLEAVGLKERMEHLPTQLSGGEQQRVAVARALANEPLVLLADEPSGNLDGPTSMGLHDLLFRLREEQGTSMVLVTHNMELARRSDRILRMDGGRLHALVPEEGGPVEVPEEEPEGVGEA